MLSTVSFQETIVYSITLRGIFSKVVKVIVFFSQHCVSTFGWLR